MGFRKYKPGIPLVGSCSAAISAACHPPQGDDKPSRKVVQWGSCGPMSTLGMTGDDQTLSSGESETGHCSLTSFNVEPPVEGAFVCWSAQKEGDLSCKGGNKQIRSPRENDSWYLVIVAQRIYSMLYFVGVSDSASITGVGRSRSYCKGPKAQFGRSH